MLAAILACCSSSQWLSSTDVLGQCQAWAVQFVTLYTPWLKGLLGWGIWAVLPWPASTHAMNYIEFASQWSAVADSGLHEVMQRSRLCTEHPAAPVVLHQIVPSCCASVMSDGVAGIGHLLMGSAVFTVLHGRCRW